MENMNNLDARYLELLKDIKENGVRKEGRNGVTYSVFGRTIKHNMQDGFPLLTTKQMYFKGIVTELLWFLSGSSNLQDLVKQGNNIWVGDAYKKYVEAGAGNIDSSGIPYVDSTDPYTEAEFIEQIKNNDEFARKWGDLGPIYGVQWRKWQHRSWWMNGTRPMVEEESIDQIQNLIDTLKTNPDSRRMLVNAWNVGEIDDMTLPPCHYGFQVWTRELTIEERQKLYYSGKHQYDGGAPAIANPNNEFIDEHSRVPKRGISLIWNQRSVDTPLGLPFNIASYGLLLTMIAQEVGMVPLELIGSLGDTHIYENQLEGVEEQLKREPRKLPKIQVDGGINATLEDIYLENYNSHGRIDFPLSN